MTGLGQSPPPSSVHLVQAHPVPACRYAAAMPWNAIKTCVLVVCTPAHLKRTALIAFVVGSWLNLFNHGDALVHGAVSAHLAIKLALNYLTPFVVSNVGLLARRRH